MVLHLMLGPRVWIESDGTSCFYTITQKSVGGTPGFGSKSGENAWFMHNFNTMLGFNAYDLMQKE
jgi:hypothetical protein